MRQSSVCVCWGGWGGGFSKIFYQLSGNMSFKKALDNSVSDSNSIQSTVEMLKNIPILTFKEIVR